MSQPPLCSSVSVSSLVSTSSSKSIEFIEPSSEQASASVDTYGVPVTVKHRALNTSKCQIWMFFHILDKPMQKSEVQSQQVNKKRKINSTGFKHICLLCLSDAMKVTCKAGTRTSRDWTTALCTQSSSSNAKKHLDKKHADNEEYKQFKKSEQLKNTKRSSVQTSSTIVSMFKKQSEASIKVKLAKWIMYENLPFNVLQSDYFK